MGAGVGMHDSVIGGGYGEHDRRGALVSRGRFAGLGYGQTNRRPGDTRRGRTPFHTVRSLDDSCTVAGRGAAVLAVMHARIGRLLARHGADMALAGDDLVCAVRIAVVLLADHRHVTRVPGKLLWSDEHLSWSLTIGVDGNDEVLANRARRDAVNDDGLTRVLCWRLHCSYLVLRI